jgi:S1-C subfamily serine protease
MFKHQWNEPHLPTLYKQTSPAVVWIGAERGPDDYDYWHYDRVNDSIKWQGTGFFVTPNLIATAGHVVKNTESFEVMFSDGTRAKADFVHMESLDRCDVGFIRLRSEHRKNRPYLRIDTKVRIGEELIILGYPWGLNNGITLTQGIVSLVGRNESYFGTKLVLHTDTASWPGNSGSPVVDMDGECVGILIGGMQGCDNFSIVTPARLVELAMQKALAEIGLRDAR